MAGKKIVFTNADLILTLAGAAAKQGRRVTESDLGFLPKSSMVVEDGKIRWIGPHRALPRQFAKSHYQDISMRGETLLPGLVECHTHTVFAGSRASEFEQRNQGATYAEIAAKGGGILSTMTQTRRASPRKLLELAQAATNRFVAQGVTTLEVKSGYALSLAGELKMLQVASSLTGPKVIRTFLGAHAIPPEFKTASEYLEYLAKEVLPVVRQKKLAERVDIFLEKGFFPKDIASKYLQAAKDLGFSVVIHADQLNLSGGSQTAIELGALSADHVIQISDREIQKFAKSGTVAVLLPAADLYLKCAYPPARKLIDAGAVVALATDYNPGSSPTQDLSLVGLLARLEMKMTLPEVISAYTVGAAAALGRLPEVGSLELGKSADFFSTSSEWSDLFYSVGRSGAKEVCREGRRLFKSSI